MNLINERSYLNKCIYETIWSNMNFGRWVLFLFRYNLVISKVGQTVMLCDVRWLYICAYFHHQNINPNPPTYMQKGPIAVWKFLQKFELLLLGKANLLMIKSGKSITLSHILQWEIYFRRCGWRYYWNHGLWRNMENMMVSFALWVWRQLHASCNMQINGMTSFNDRRHNDTIRVRGLVSWNNHGLF